MLAAVSVSGASSVKLAAFGSVPTETVPALVRVPSMVRLEPPSGSEVSWPPALTSTVPRTVLRPASTKVIADESVIEFTVNGASTIGLPSATVTLVDDVGTPALQSEAAAQGSLVDHYVDDVAPPPTV
jgi:hypothetical protein